MNKKIVGLFKERFERDCITLLLESYNTIIASGINLSEMKENDITLKLFLLMKKNTIRTDKEISITREFYLDDQNTTSADESLRIDIKYTVWNKKKETDYFIEAKNVSESNWIKSNGTSVNARSQGKRYIDIGIQNFITQTYPLGCLVGYVVNGDYNNVVTNLNDLLSEFGRSTEHLKNVKLSQINFHYISAHSKANVSQLRHYFLKFC